MARRPLPRSLQTASWTPRISQPGPQSADGAAGVAAPLQRHTSSLKRSAETLKHVRGGNFLLPYTSCAQADRVSWWRVWNVAARAVIFLSAFLCLLFFCQTSVISQSAASCPDSPDSSLTLTHTHSLSHSCSLPLAPEQCSSLWSAAPPCQMLYKRSTSKYFMGCWMALWICDGRAEAPLGIECYTTWSFA